MRGGLCFKTTMRVISSWKQEKVVSPDWDWKNFGEEEKKKTSNISPPLKKRSPPTRDSQLETPYRFKKRGCILRRTLIQQCHLKQITFALPVRQIGASLCLSVMFGMLRRHLHPGIFFFLLWLCHLLEHQKVQGKLCSCVSFFNSLNKRKNVAVRH